jgi:hypothetical protein
MTDSSTEGAAPTAAVSSGARVIEAGDGAWEVTATGAARSGSGRDAGAPILLLTFSRRGAPEALPREVFAVARSLDELSDDELAELVARSKAIRRAGPERIEEPQADP